MHWSGKLVLSAVWVLAGTSSYLIVPEAGPFLLPLASLAPILWYPEPGLMRHLWAPSLLARLLAVASAYFFINATWSTAQGPAYIGAATFFAVSVVVHVVSRTMAYLDREPVRSMSTGFYAAFVVCALLASIEIIFKNPLYLSFLAKFPALAPQKSGIVIEAGIVKSLPSYLLNRQMAALVFLFWPALLVASRLASSPALRWVLAACLAPAIAAIFMSDHETSKLAIAGGAVVFGLVSLAPRLTKPLLTAAWVLACVAVVPLTSLAYHQQLHKAAWLQPSAQHRIVIWGVTSSKVAEAPWLGHGLVAARELALRDKEQPTYADGSPFMLSTGWHAHNVYLQAWFDAGAVGAALLLAIGLFVLGSISRVTADVQPVLYAAFSSNALLAGSSFSIWSSWFLASCAFSAIFAVLAWRFATTARDEDNALASG